MPSFKQITFLFLLLQATFLINHQVKSDDEEDNLLQGINKYRASLNLTAFAKNENAACYARQTADQFKGQPCTNTTDTILGIEPQFLVNCHLNTSGYQVAEVMPACVPKLDPSLVLTKFTQSKYLGSLNDTANTVKFGNGFNLTYTIIGIGSEGDWIVVVLGTNTSGSIFEDATGAGSIFSPNLLIYLVAVFMGLFVIIG
ncbi:putative GPI-anchored protein At3g06035 [Silene latifolia]|uniref:putative GPI-anchored protein At3g06035 n=1 Tax=Silene latifolia TaxID=37657 RepID=UPI003D780A8A